MDKPSTGMGPHSEKEEGQEKGRRKETWKAGAFLPASKNSERACNSKLFAIVWRQLVRTATAY